VTGIGVLLIVGSSFQGETAYRFPLYGHGFSDQNAGLLGGVGRQINSSKYEGFDCIEPINPL
jgi:hypothetical protein